MLMKLRQILKPLQKSFSTVMNEIKTFVVLDCETTGLPQYESFRTKITELCLIAVQAEHILLGTFPRIQNKWSICLNPCKQVSLTATDLTGLSNELLEHQPKFSQEVVKAITNFLNICPQPICLVAHNGNKFDYPILRTEIEKTGLSLPESILCVDSLVAFRELLEKPKTETEKDVPFEFADGYDEFLCEIADEMESTIKRISEVQKQNETTPKKQIITSSVKCPPRRQLFPNSFKLSDVYSRLTKKRPIDAHQAEADCVMLLSCLAACSEDFVNWANVNAKKFNEMPLMSSAFNKF